MTNMLIMLFLMMQFFMKTGKCKFGSKCKFNHPKEKVNALASGKTNDVSCFHLLTRLLTCHHLNRSGLNLYALL